MSLLRIIEPLRSANTFVELQETDDEIDVIRLSWIATSNGSSFLGGNNKQALTTHASPVRHEHENCQ